jgi:lauroyl/myristoyl acyltransferase
MTDPVASIAGLPLPLPWKLQLLRGLAGRGSRSPKLRRWAAEHPEIAAGEGWCRRAWWGVAAGRVVRRALDDPRRRPAALRLAEPADLAPLEQARREGGGVIVLAAHLGPPKFLMHWLLEQSLPLLVWTNADDLPGWLPATRPGTFLDPRPPAERGVRLVQTALHLRRGGVLLAAADLASGDRPVTIERLGLPWRFSFGLPALAKRLQVPVVSTLALWQGCRVRVRCLPLEPPDPELPEEAWRNAWLDRYWQIMEPVVRDSPENLRFLRWVVNPRGDALAGGGSPHRPASFS